MLGRFLIQFRRGKRLKQRRNKEAIESARAVTEVQEKKKTRRLLGEPHVRQLKAKRIAELEPPDPANPIFEYIISLFNWNV